MIGVLATAALVAQALVSAPVAAAASVPDPRIAQSMVILPTLGGVSTRPAAVGPGGHIVGQSQLRDGRWRAALWYRGVVRNLGTVGGHTSRATQVNASGRVVGRYYLPGSRTGGFVWYAGTFTDLGLLGGTRLEPKDVDSRGRVTGTWTAKSGTTRGFVHQGGRTLLLPASPSRRTRVTGFFAPDGWILGTAELVGGDRRPVYWKDLGGGRWSAPRVLLAPSHHGRGEIVDITAARHFVATDGPPPCCFVNGRHGYLSRRGEIVPIAIGTASRPAALSSSDVVVGTFHGEGSGGAYVWGQAAGARKLPDLPTAAGASQYSEANDINDRGQVVGSSRSVAWSYAAVAWCGDDVVHLQGVGDYDKAIAVTASGFVLGQVGPNGRPRAATWRLSAACAPVLP